MFYPLLFFFLLLQSIWPIMSRIDGSKFVLFLAFYWLMAVAAQESCIEDAHQGGILYPRESETREVKLLDGFWNFRASDGDPLAGFSEKWYAQDLAKVRVNLRWRTQNGVEERDASLYHYCSVTE